MQRLRGAQKSSKGAPFYSLYVNRPLGRVFAALAYRIQMTPNQVTAVSAVFTFAAIALIAVMPTGPVTGPLVMIGLVLGYVLDSADGQLARLRGGGSVTGEWLDHVIDSGKIVAIHLAVLIAWYRNYDLPAALGGSVLLLIPIGLAIISVVHFFGMILNEQLTRNKQLQAGVEPKPSGGSSPRWMSLAKLPTDYGLLCLVFVTLGFPSVFMILYGLITLANLGYLILVLPKWFRDMGRLDALVPQSGRGR